MIDLIIVIKYAVNAVQSYLFNTLIMAEIPVSTLLQLNWMHLTSPLHSTQQSKVGVSVVVWVLTQKLFDKAWLSFNISGKEPSKNNNRGDIFL